MADKPTTTKTEQTDKQKETPQYQPKPTYPRIVPPKDNTLDYSGKAKVVKPQ